MVFKRKIIKVVEVKMSQNWKDTGGLRQAKELLGDLDLPWSKTCRSLCKKKSQVPDRIYNGALQAYL